MRRLVFVVFSISGAVSIPSLWAQQQFSLLRYTAVDGLPQSQVNMMVEDGNGYLWIGTNGGGLARFDGNDFKVYTTRNGLLSNVVQYLKLDSRQNLWIISPRGVTRFDGLEFRRFQPDLLSNKMSIRRVFEVNDTLFFVNNQRMLAKIHNDSVYYWNKPIRPERFVLYTHLMPSREICLYMDDRSIMVKSVRGEVVINHADFFRQARSMFNFQDELWLSTENGYYSLDLENRTFVKRELDILNTIIQYDSLNRIFWTRNGDTLLKEYWTGQSHRIDTVFQESTITQILTDSEGNTWMGSAGNGLYKYFVKDFDRCASERLGSVTAITKGPGGESWIGTANRGIWRIDHGVISSFTVNSPSDNAVRAIQVSPKGAVWIATYNGLGWFDHAANKFKYFTREDGLSSIYINDIDIDPNENVWYATNSGGVGVFDGTRFINYSIDDGLYARNASTISHFAKYHTTFVGSEFGLNSIKDGVVKKVSIPEFANTIINTLHTFRDSLLIIGSGGAGLMFYDPSRNVRKVLDSRDGLPSDFIYFAVEDKEGYVWVGTEQGVTRLRLSESLDIYQNLHYGFENGLVGVETNRNAFFVGEEKYFGLIDGVYQYNDLPRSTWHSFDLHLTDVELFYGRFSSRSFADSLTGLFRIPYRPVLPPDKNHITFHFNKVDKRYPKSVKYKYYLSNFDKTWSQPSANGQATYSNLPPGSYVFQAVATDSQGGWSSNPLAYAFVIEAPFYQMASFQMIAASVLIGLVALYLYWRVRNKIGKMLEVERIRAQEQESLRKEIARDFHDEMGNQLTRIINYVSLLKLTKNGNASALYDKVEDSAKYLYTGTRDFIWSIDPGNDELSKLFIHIRDFGEKLFEEKNINFRANNHVKESMRLPYGFSREANLILKEAMTNAFNHANPKNVTFSMNKVGETFEMVLEDDGKGFDLEQLPNLNGIKNMRTRAERLNSQLEIASSPGKGATLKLKLTTKTTKQKA
ncbi:MAG: two-component regulator propeller domain-containing protein [Cyclobacteriaceae bacterium]